MKRIQAIAAMALLLGACTSTEYVFTPPATPEGKACVERCQASQSSCRHTQDGQAETYRAHCEAEAEQRKAECEAQAPIKDCRIAGDSERAAACRPRENCPRRACAASPSYEVCDKDFRSCFQTCGGKIDAIER